MLYNVDKNSSQRSADSSAKKYQSLKFGNPRGRPGSNKFSQRKRKMCFLQLVQNCDLLAEMCRSKIK